jgi:hypothetical protein
MAHYAKIENGIVVDVIVADEDVIQTYDGTWLQTSYNTHGGQHPEGRPLRMNYAGIGYTYDYGRDAFIPPKPQIGTWVLNDNTCLWERVDTDVIP